VRPSRRSFRKGGTGYGGGDSPQFIQDMFNWLKSSNLGYHSYFNYNAPDGAHLLSEYPRAQTKYKQLFDSLPAPFTP
jgi:hypothetical protein